MTPYYTEEVLFSLTELEEPNEDGVSILFYLQKIFPGLCFECWEIYHISPSLSNLNKYLADEWNNFLERLDCLGEEELRGSDESEDQLRHWASYRGQTLTRTGKNQSNSQHSVIYVLFNVQKFPFLW